jgi:hypothetical protein
MYYKSVLFFKLCLCAAMYVKCELAGLFRNRHAAAQNFTGVKQNKTKQNKTKQNKTKRCRKREIEEERWSSARRKRPIQSPRRSSHSFEACATVPNTVCGAYLATTFACRTLESSRFDTRFLHLVHHVELFACVLAGIPAHASALALLCSATAAGRKNAGARQKGGGVIITPAQDIKGVG